MANWNLIKILGSGAFGDVSLWNNIETGESVAIKMCSVDLNTRDPDERDKLVKRWQNELTLMTNVDIDYIVRAVPELCPDLVENLNRTFELPVIVMEYCDGGNLRTKMQQIENVNGLSENDVRQVLSAISKAVSYLHEHCDKTIHRDIKPDNIVIKFGPTGKPIYKLADLGYARQLDRTIEASMVGTRNYFAPEIVDKGSYNSSVDFWSLGVVGFEIICGVKPFLPTDNMYTILASIKEKPSGCIAITRSNDDKKIFHTKLFPENRLTAKFCSLIESWLQLALETDMHKRGVNGTSDELHGKKSMSMFYRKLDAALNSKILTVYWLNRLMFLSYCVSESTTMESLISQMESDTGVNRSKFYFVLPVGHSCKMFSPQVQPFELHDEKFAFDDRPMIYLFDFHTDGLCQPNSPFISNVISEIFNLDGELQSWVRTQCLLNTLFLHHNELRRDQEFVNGIREFAMILENDAMKQEEHIKVFQDNVLYCGGQVTHFEMMLTVGQQILKGPLSMKSIADDWKMIAQNMNIHSRIRGVLTRIRTFMEKAPFDKYLEDVVLHVKKFEDVFDRVFPSPNSITTEDFQIYISSLLKVQKNFTERSKRLLQAKDSIIEIYNEFQAIMKTVCDSQSMLVHFKKRLSEETAQYMKKFVQVSISQGCFWSGQNLMSEADNTIDEVSSFLKEWTSEPKTVSE